MVVGPDRERKATTTSAQSFPRYGKSPRGLLLYSFLMAALLACLSKGLVIHLPVDFISPQSHRLSGMWSLLSAFLLSLLHAGDLTGSDSAEAALM